MNRIQLITKIVKGKDVLDIGRVQHKMVNEKKSQWLHKHLVGSANYVLGVDILEDEVKKANELGYNFVCGDAEHLQDCTDRKFDVCVAGELIEHLSNPGLFVQSAGACLREGGILIITTPNAFALGNILRIFKYALRIPPDNINDEHKAWYCFVTLRQLLEAHDFEIDKMFSIRPSRESNFISRIKEIVYGRANSKIICIAKKL